MTTKKRSDMLNGSARSRIATGAISWLTARIIQKLSRQDCGLRTAKRQSEGYRQTPLQRRCSNLNKSRPAATLGNARSMMLADLIEQRADLHLSEYQMQLRKATSDHPEGRTERKSGR